MEEKRKVSFEEGHELARHYEIPFLETSAKNSVNVESSFLTMTKEIKNNVQNKSSAAGNNLNKNNVKFGQGNFLHQKGQNENDSTEDGQNKKKGGCCAG